MQVDYERAWLALKTVIAEKKSHGQRDLFTEMGRIEVESMIEEDGIDPRPPLPARSGRSRRPAAGPPREVARHG